MPAIDSVIKSKERSMTQKALIIIDMLNDFVDESGALYCGKSVHNIIGFIQKRLEAYRKAGDLVIYLQDSHTADDKEFDLFPPTACAAPGALKSSMNWPRKPVSSCFPKPDSADFTAPRWKKC